ncbi:1217_t:CDS:2 [Ambispora gerdemannii]|uniref:1217_t:CDS:1 n=1 Tax=Ambispora gerdemannii TaxID=144530 RepID=A0A9N9AWW7_9GLOM|nr:1217_t:CDS:2 [Ambispora gerdemannii]
MGTCVHVSEDRNRILTFYSSELIFAEAAASLMSHKIVFKILLNFILGALRFGYVKPAWLSWRAGRSVTFNDGLNENLFYDAVTSKFSEEYVFENNETTCNKAKPYLSLYSNWELRHRNYAYLTLTTHQAQTHDRIRQEDFWNPRDNIVCAFGLYKTVYNCLDKWNQDDIDILKLIRDAWPDPMELASGEKKLFNYLYNK